MVSEHLGECMPDRDHMADDGTIDSTADTLDDISRGFIRLADRLWSEARERRIAGELSAADYSAVRAQCRALIRRAVEVVSSASTLRIEQSKESVAALETCRADLERTQQQIAKTTDIMRIALIAVTACTLLVTAVAAPGAGSMMAAADGVRSLVTAM
jgi:hypothetical protein